MILDIIRLILPSLEKVIPDINERAKAQEAITKALLENEASLNEAMAKVMAADAQSESRLTRNARPITVLTCLSLLIYLVLIAPLLGTAQSTIEALQGVPSELWYVITAGIGLYQIARTFDKRGAAK